MVANMSKHRDTTTIIRAAKILAEENRSLKVFLIGDGEKSYESKEMVSKLGLSELVHVLGYRSDIENYISLFNVSVLLSNIHQHYEGLSNFLMESIALRKVIIATRGGGNLELIQDGYTGYLVNPFDADELCTKLRMIQQYDQTTIKTKAYKTLLKKYSMDSYICSYYTLYKKIYSQNTTYK